MFVTQLVSKQSKAMIGPRFDKRREKTLKNARKVCDFEKARSAKAQKVERPPLKTAGPM